MVTIPQPYLICFETYGHHLQHQEGKVLDWRQLLSLSIEFIGAPEIAETFLEHLLMVLCVSHISCSSRVCTRVSRCEWETLNGVVTQSLGSCLSDYAVLGMVNFVAELFLTKNTTT